MTDKVQKIKDWISKEQDVINPFSPDEDGKNSDFENGRLAMATQVLQYIDSMQEEPVSEEFEEALAKEWQGYVDRGAATVDALEDNTQELAFAKGFCRGVNWQKEKDDKLFTIVYMDGVEKGKQQMMKDSISATIESDLDPHGADYGNQKIVCEWGELEAKKFKEGTKVKLIIIKED